MANVAGDASVGQRKNQEDAFRVVLQSEQDPQGDVLMMVADGMGGHIGGEIASNLALEEFERFFVSGSKTPRPRDRLNEAAVKANDALRQRIELEPKLKGMGCTLLCALKLNNRLIWASIGDSSLFLFRGGRLEKLNADHSVYGELLEHVAAGKLSQEEADAHPRRNALRSAVTGDPLTLVDLNSLDLQPGDTVVLASDGIDTLPQSKVAEILAQTHSMEPAARATALLDAVEAVGKATQDNTTIVVYHQEGGGVGGAYEDSLWKLNTPAIAAEKSNLPVLLAGAGIGALAVLILMLILWPRPDPIVEQTEAETTELPQDDDGVRAIGGQEPTEPEVEPEGATPEEQATPEESTPLAEEDTPTEPDTQAAPDAETTPEVTPEAIPEPSEPDQQVSPETGEGTNALPENEG